MFSTIYLGSHTVIVKYHTKNDITPQLFGVERTVKRFAQPQLYNLPAGIDSGAIGECQFMENRGNNFHVPFTDRFINQICTRSAISPTCEPQFQVHCWDTMILDIC